jgi:hypothetical protein
MREYAMCHTPLTAAQSRSLDRSIPGGITLWQYGMLIGIGGNTNGSSSSESTRCMVIAAVYCVDVDPVDAPAAVGHVRAKAAVVAVVAQVVHECERGGLVGALRVMRRESEVDEEA